MQTEFYKISRTPLGVRFFCINLFLISMIGLGCESSSGPVTVKFSGQTMGTTYSVSISNLPDGTTSEILQEGVSRVLVEVNQQMSNWIDDSEISRFNRLESTDWFEVSPETAKVIAESIRISQDSKGAFDVTVAPLIDAWGFGPVGREVDPPDEQQLERLKAIIGSEKLASRTEPAAIKKTDAEVTVNLSAIAKGAGVDAVAEYLESQGVTAYLVEIGGEIRVAGLKPNGEKWRVGIERPNETGRSLQNAVSLTDQAMATSGDYRNFIEYEGKKYSHTIDPRELKPITHELASVTVLAANCLQADAWATALMVMGPANGYDWAEDRGMAVLMLIHAGDGFEERATTTWKQQIGEKP
jgi:thiamine biosynthesis lipoprotein